MARQSAKSAIRAAQSAEKKAAGTGVHLGAATADSFVNFAHKLGMNADNPLAASSYSFNPITRNRTLLEWMHRGSWLAGLAIDIPAADMTRKGVEYKTELPPSDAERLDTYMTAYQTWHHVQETIQWARLYGGAICVALIDGQDPRTPLRLDSIGPGQYKGLLVLDRWQLEPELGDLVTEYGPHLGLPKYYRVTENAPALRGAVVHYTRIPLRLTGIALPYQQRLTENLWGISVLERLFDRMTGFDSATTGAMQLVYKAYLRTLKIKGMRDIVAAGGKPLDGLVAYTTMMARTQTIEGMTMIDAEDDFQVDHSQAFSGLSDALTQFGQQISGALQIPLIRLFGQSPTGLNSSGDADLRTYYDGISSAQQRDLFHGVNLIYRLAARSAEIRVPDNFMMTFRALLELSDVEKADLAGKVVTAVTQAKDSGLVSDKVAMKELRQSARTTGIFTNITDDDLEAADDQINPPPPAGDLLDGLGEMNGNAEVRPNGEAQRVPAGPRRRVVVQPATASGRPAGTPALDGLRSRFQRRAA